ncbi:glycosyltransferase family 39 protein [Pedobacter sp. SYP-B3415]|uniref:ArnT family glycosyltransferase n=1 Tax=Pedobacter sp. SYP-B3415 TaxID=2496641 RepID=UPI00101C44C2|nr:glycosyltransferase family 39 protein [Pedobacter sp. SYP-B3415]
MPSEKVMLYLLGLLILLGAAGIAGPVMEPDAALYASIAKNIVLRNDWINLYGNGGDWLDKPHLPFWLAAASFKVFGINAFSYKLPSFLVGLLGLGYLYKLTAGLYNRQTALLAALIYFSALHLILCNFDVRAEVYLTTFCLAALYHYYHAQEGRWLTHIIAGSFMAALAVMTKGIFVLMPLFGGFILYWLFSGHWRMILKLRWWLAIALIFIFIGPELWCLYRQFDLHPEKVVFGKTGVSGIRFFFWDSQFGRFFNSGPIKGKGDISFFIHTSLWAFLPWSLLLFTAAGYFLLRVKQGMSRSSVIFIVAGLTFLIFSFSKFQLPHYIILVFPQFAILTAAYLGQLNYKGLLIWRAVQISICLLASVLLAVIIFFFKVPNAGIFYVLTALAIILMCWKGREPRQSSLVWSAVSFSLLFLVFVNFFFYPALLKYQAGMQAAKWSAAKGLKGRPVIYRQLMNAYAFEFYHPGLVARAETPEALDGMLQNGPLIVYADQAAAQELEERFAAVPLQTFERYHITRLKPKFLNASTRPGTLETFVLLKITR